MALTIMANFWSTQYLTQEIPFIQQGHLTPVNIKYVNIFTDKHFSVSTIRRKKWKSVIPP